MRDLIENIVVDTNVLISALIRDSLTRDVIFELNYNLLIPEAMIREVISHKGEILVKSGLSNKEFIDVLSSLLLYIEIVPNVKLLDKMGEAIRIIGDIDMNDISLIATALLFDKCGIWSNDKHLKKQNKVRVLTTNELLLFLGFFPFFK